MREVIARKSKNYYIATCIIACVLAAIFIAACVITSVVEVSEAERIVLPVLFAASAILMAVMAVIYGKRARRIATLPSELIIFTGEKLHLFTRVGCVAVLPREVERVDEKPIVNRFRSFNYGNLNIILRDGRTLVVENVDDLSAAKQRLIEQKTLASVQQNIG